MKTGASRCLLLLAFTAANLVGGCRTPATSGDSARDLPADRSTGQLEVVARLNSASPAGVAASSTGRVFLSFPRWDRGVQTTVGEWKDGRLVPYPSAARNELDEEAPSEHFLSVENLTMGPEGDLWLLDTGRPGFEEPVDGAAKLVRVDLGTDEVVETFVLPDDVAHTESYLSGLTIDADRGPSGMAYITDASPSGRTGLVVVDLQDGDAWRKLDLHPSTRATPEFVPLVEGRPMYFQPKGWRRDYMSLGANGIAVAPGTGRVYYTAMASREIFSVSAAALADPEMPGDRVAATIFRHGDARFASDGLAADAEGRLYLGNYEHNAVMKLGTDGTITTLAHDRRLLWPDGLAVADGWVYVVANQRHRGGVFNKGRDLREKPYVLFRVPLDGDDASTEIDDTDA